MENEPLSKPGFWSRLDWERFDDIAAYGPFFILFMHVLGIVQHDPELLQMAVVGWTGLYVIVSTVGGWRIWRARPDDRWRAIACLAYGAPPCALFYVAHGALTAWPAVIVTTPLVVVWGAGAQLLALFGKPRPRPPKVRALVLGGAAMICGLASFPLFVGVAIGVAMGVWDPPPVVRLLSPVVIGICLPLGFANGYASLKLAGEAMAAWRGRPETASP